MASDKIETLVGITPKRLRELEQAEARLAAVREVVTMLRAPFDTTWSSEQEAQRLREVQKGHMDAADLIETALEATV